MRPCMLDVDDGEVYVTCCSHSEQISYELSQKLAKLAQKYGLVVMQPRAGYSSYEPVEWRDVHLCFFMLPVHPYLTRQRDTLTLPLSYYAFLYHAITAGLLDRQSVKEVLEWLEEVGVTHPPLVYDLLGVSLIN